MAEQRATSSVVPQHLVGLYWRAHMSVLETVFLPTLKPQPQPWEGLETLEMLNVC